MRAEAVRTSEMRTRLFLVISWFRFSWRRSGLQRGRFYNCRSELEAGYVETLSGTLAFQRRVGMNCRLPNEKNSFSESQNF